MKDDVLAHKDRLRGEILAARRQMSSEQRAAAGAAIATHGLAQWRGVHTLAAYLSVRTEPPTDLLLDRLAASGTRLLLPVVDGPVLDWAVYDGSRTMTAGPLGISEPIGERLGVDAVLQANVVVVPAFAVDHDGHRLGRGRGFYDRTLLGVAAPIIAVVYDAELIDVVPTESHDQRVDGVLRPSGLTSWS